MLKYFASSLKTILAQHQNLKPVVISSLKIGDLALAKPKVTSAFTSSLSESVKYLIENHWSRIQVKSIEPLAEGDKHVMTIFYCDYGFEDQFIAGCDSYDFIHIPVQFKIWPKFVYECVLNENLVMAKLAAAKVVNDFCDSIYLNEYIGILCLFIFTEIKGRCPTSIGFWPY